MDNFNNTNTDSLIKKLIINYMIMIFGFIIVIIFILLSLYYITPNNYQIITFNNNDDNKLKFVSQNEYTIEPNSSKQIDLVNSNIYIRFSEQTELVISNLLKSQNISISKDNELIKIMYGSTIYIINNSMDKKKINVKTYLLDY